MADDVKKVNEKSSGGFLTPTGELKSKESLKKEEAEAAKQRSADAVQSEVKPRDAAAALGAVERRTYEQTNTALKQNDEARALVDAQKDIVAQKAKVAKQLQDETDEAKRAELKEQFAKLDKQDKALAKEASSFNRSSSEQGARRINVGNKNFGSFEPAKVEAPPPKKTNLDSNEVIAGALKELKAREAGLNLEGQKLDKQRKNIEEAGKNALNEVSDIKGSVNLSLEQAEQVAKNIAAEIRQAGASQASQALGAFNPGKSGGIPNLQQMLSALQQ